MNPNFIDQDLYKEYERLFKGHDEAWNFIATCCEYYECVDDHCDDVVTHLTVRKLTSLACMVYSHSYWTKHKSSLYLVDRIIHCQYFDSVEWEGSGESWKREHAKVLSHPAVNMVFAVILIEFSQSVLDNISSRFREHAHRLHLKDTI